MILGECCRSRQNGTGKSVPVRSSSTVFPQRDWESLLESINASVLKRKSPEEAAFELV